MDWDGILKACTTKVVPNSARITVTSSDSIYSRSVAGRASVCCAAPGRDSTTCAVSDIVAAAQSLRFQLYQGRYRCGLFSFFFGFSQTDGGNFPGDANLNPKRLLVVR